MIHCAFIFRFIRPIETLRIIRGKYRGKQINPPGNLSARPTTDFAKSGLFNILSNYFEFSKLEVLDLFSGMGSIGFEFASREVEYVEMVEKNTIHFRFIRNTIEKLGMNNARVLNADAFIYPLRLKRKFDIIFADPPYDLENINTLPGIIFKNQLLKNEGWFILEHSREHDFSTFPFYSDTRNYGNVRFSFFKNNSI